MTKFLFRLPLLLIVSSLLISKVKSEEILIRTPYAKADYKIIEIRGQGTPQCKGFVRSLYPGSNIQRISFPSAPHSENIVIRTPYESAKYKTIEIGKPGAVRYKGQTFGVPYLLLSPTVVYIDLSYMWIHMGDLDVFTLDMGILSSSFEWIFSTHPA